MSQHTSVSPAENEDRLIAEAQEHQSHHISFLPELPFFHLHVASGLPILTSSNVSSFLLLILHHSVLSSGHLYPSLFILCSLSFSTPGFCPCCPSIHDTPFCPLPSPPHLSSCSSVFISGSFLLEAQYKFGGHVLEVSSVDNGSVSINS